MKKLFALIFTFLMLVSPVFAADVVAPPPSVPLTDAFIRYNLIGWQTYYFYIDTNTGVDGNNLEYEWTVDDTKVFKAPHVQYFFETGDHEIKVRVQDPYGNIRYDKVKLAPAFWSLHDNWFWWAWYLLLVLLAVYYWVIRIIALVNYRRAGARARYFIDALDEHDWVSQLVEEHYRVNAPSEIDNLKEEIVKNVETGKPTGRKL